MTGVEWYEAMLNGEASRRAIPLEYTATPPLPVDGRREVVCWYYRLWPSGAADRLMLAPPAFAARWDADALALVERRPTGDGGAPREVAAAPFLAAGAGERRYLEGPFDSWLNGGAVDADALRSAWLEAMPEALRALLADRA